MISSSVDELSLLGSAQAITVGTAARINGSVAQRLSRPTEGNVVRTEHPTGFSDVEIDVQQDEAGDVQVDCAANFSTDGYSRVANSS
jgi:4-oxalomesaconate tautomerase